MYHTIPPSNAVPKNRGHTIALFKNWVQKIKGDIPTPVQKKKIRQAIRFLIKAKVLFNRGLTDIKKQMAYKELWNNAGFKTLNGVVAPDSSFWVGRMRNKL